MKTSITRRGEQINIYGRAWWTSHAVSTPIGIMIARIRTDGGFLDLTEDDLNGLETPGEYHIKAISAGFMDVEIRDCERPATNRTDAPISEQQQVEALEMLYTEGYGWSGWEIVDRTPYHGGDAGDVLFEERE